MRNFRPLLRLFSTRLTRDQILARQKTLDLIEIPLSDRSQNLVSSGFDPEKYLLTHPDPEKALGIRQQMEELSVLIEKLNARQQAGNKVIVFAASMFLTTSIAYTLFQFSDVNTILSACMPSPFKLFDYPTARSVLCFFARYDLLPMDFASEDPYMIRETNFVGKIRNLRFCVPIGLGAGIDINCEGPAGLLKLGFGSIEIGNVSVSPTGPIDEANVQLVNEQQSILASVGRRDASKGLDVVSEKLCDYIQYKRPNDLLSRNTVTGISIIIVSPNDIISVFKNVRLIENADYISFDVSSIDSVDALCRIIDQIDQSCAKAISIPGLFIKVGLAQSLPPNTQVVQKINSSLNIVGVNIKGSGIANVNSVEMRVSGAASRQASTLAVSAWYQALNRSKEIIASGGIACGRDALAKIEAGASNVQLFSAFAFEGAQVARRIKTQLSIQLMNKGYYNLEEAIGAQHREPTARLKEAMKRRKRF